MQDSSPAIVYEGIEKNFGSLKVLQGISGSINRGEVVAVIGSSGCGKSTLLRCFNRLEKIDRGRLEVNGIDLSRPDIPHKQVRKLHTNVGMVFQQFNLFPHLSVLDNLILAPRRVLGKSKQESEKQARFYLNKVGLAEKAESYPDQLSG
jgi:arginine/lysine/histidine/glutamine transport system ATP-binding protein